MVSSSVKEEFVISGLITLFLSFVYVNFSTALGVGFSILHTADFILLFTLVYVIRNRSDLIYPTEADSNRFVDFLIGVVAFGSYVLVSSFVASLLKGFVPSTFSLSQSVFETLASATPILAGSVVLSAILFAVIVPNIETRLFFGRVFEWLGWAFRIDVSRLSVGSLALAGVVSVGFTLFHLTVRAVGAGLTFDTLGILLTFVFGMVSLLLIMIRKTKELAPIIWLHILVNSAALTYNTPAGKALINSIIS